MEAGSSSHGYSRLAHSLAVVSRVVQFVKLFCKRTVSPPYLMHFFNADHDEPIDIYIF